MGDDECSQPAANTFMCACQGPEEPPLESGQDSVDHTWGGPVPPPTRRGYSYGEGYYEEMQRRTAAPGGAAAEVGEEEEGGHDGRHGRAAGQNPRGLCVRHMLRDPERAQCMRGPAANRTLAMAVMLVKQLRDGQAFFKVPSSKPPSCHRSSIWSGHGQTWPWQS